jgi:hypothetical protein
MYQVMIFFSLSLANGKMMDEWQIGKYLFGSVPVLIKKLLWHLPVRIEENHEKPQYNWCRSRDSNLASKI